MEPTQLSPRQLLGKSFIRAIRAWIFRSFYFLRVVKKTPYYSRNSALGYLDPTQIAYNRVNRLFEEQTNYHRTLYFIA